LESLLCGTLLFFVEAILLMATLNDKNHIENDPSYKGLKVNKGVKNAPSINPDAAKRIIKRKKQLSVDDYVNGILKGNVTILSRAVTMVESARPEHQHSPANY